MQLLYIEQDCFSFKVTIFYSETDTSSSGSGILLHLPLENLQTRMQGIEPGTFCLQSMSLPPMLALKEKKKCMESLSGFKRGARYQIGRAWV